MNSTRLDISIPHSSGLPHFVWCSYYFCKLQMGTHHAMQCFFATPDGLWMRNTFRGVEAYSSKAGEGRLGMMISRRPYRRASTENAPGPRHKRAIAMMAVKTEISLAALISGLEPGSEANATLKLPRAATKAERVVR